MPSARRGSATSRCRRRPGRRTRTAVRRTRQTATRPSPVTSGVRTWGTPTSPPISATDTIAIAHADERQHARTLPDRQSDRDRNDRRHDAGDRGDDRHRTVGERVVEGDDADRAGGARLPPPTRDRHRREFDALVSGTMTMRSRRRSRSPRSTRRRAGWHAGSPDRRRSRTRRRRRPRRVRGRSPRASRQPIML